MDGNPNNVSGDQLVPVFASQMLSKRPFAPSALRATCRQLARRLGFAQNTHDTPTNELPNGQRKLLPDFLLHRVIMFIARVYGWRTIVCFADTILFLNTLVTVIDLRLRNDPDHVDPFVNSCATLYACNVYRPTYLSKLSARTLNAGAIKTLGNNIYAETDDGIPYLNLVVGGLRWYHRAASGGNPEVGEVQVAQWLETLKIARS